MRIGCDDKSFKKVKLWKEWNHCLPDNNLVLLATRLPTEATSKGLSSGNGLFPTKEESNDIWLTTSYNIAFS